MWTIEKISELKLNATIEHFREVKPSRQCISWWSIYIIRKILFFLVFIYTTHIFTKFFIYNVIEASMIADYTKSNLHVNNLNVQKPSDIVAQFSLIQILGNQETNDDLFRNASRTPDSSLSQSSLLPSSKNYFTHLTYDEKYNAFYAGATNKIIKFNENLHVLSHTTTGPKYDSPQCHASGCSDEVETALINNYNKILIVSYIQDNSILISCGSLRQGACDIYNLSTFPNNSRFIDIPLAANDEYSSTYAFVGPAEYSWKKEDILYVGTTFTNVGDYRHDVPAISSRRLDDLNYAEFEIKQSIINIDVKYRDHFLVDYIYGFNSSEYAYFVLVQKKSHLADEAGYITRLARICITDSNYDSYTEITMQCLATDHNIDYNIIQDAKITEAGQKLSQQMGIKRDDNILITVFSPSMEISNEPENKSAVCIYSLKEIEEVFNENIHLCFNGTIKDRNLGYISGTIDDGRCPGTTGNVYSFCNVGLKISGVSPVVSHALFHFDVSITSVTAATTGPHSLVFLGTIDGLLKKVLISGQNVGEYEEISIDPGNKILQDTMISPHKDFIYVLSKSKITKLKIQHCWFYTNCSACLESRDPFCGWCSLEKRCTVRSACQKDTSAARWLSFGSGQQCIDFESILPENIPIMEVTKVQLIIRTLPEPVNGKYRCVFGNSTPIDAEILENGLSCMTPSLDERPVITINTDHVLVPLSVRSSETNKDFVSRLFAFYDCSHHNTCKMCVHSAWGCKWCIYDNKCVHKVTLCRNLDQVISKQYECPHLKRFHQPILLPVRVPKEIRFEIENLPKLKNTRSNFLCTVKIEAAQMLLPARVESNRIVICEKTPYFYESNAYEYKAKVDITWNRQHYIDTAEIILYKCDVLGSHREHADCSLCVTRDEKYQCAWCRNSCVYNETCSISIGTDRNIFSSAITNYPLFRANECPRPRIDMIKPLFGPIEGGTLVTIEGSNLGIKEEDVRGKISIGNVPCDLVSYEISVKIECRTGSVNRELVAPVKVFNDAGFTESSVQFQFKDVELTGLQPTIGPKSGGTQISLIGKYLNIGSNIRAFLDEYECHINMSQASSTRLTCTTSEAIQPQSIKTLHLLVDGANRNYTCENFSERTLEHYHTFAVRENFTRRYYNNWLGHSCSIFNYTHDPIIMEIKPLRSFISGGRLLTVHGMHLDSIQNPELEVFFGNERVNKTSCNVINSSQMECPSPAVNAKFLEYKLSLEKSLYRQRISADIASNVPFYTSFNSLSLRDYNVVRKRNTLHRNTSYLYTVSNNTDLESSSGQSVTSVKVGETQLNLQLAFVMDNVQKVNDLSKYFPNLRSNIVYVYDPIYHYFPNGVKLYKGDTLVIEGEFLNIAADESDVNVTIGTEKCNVTSLTLSQLLCTPPEKQPQPFIDFKNNFGHNTDLPLVVVNVGRNLYFPIGYLKYDLIKPYSFLSQAMWGIVFAILFLVVLFIVILIIYRRKTTQAEREYKRIQIQMITLESNVRSECKQAFAELQTDMTDLTADLETSGIPALDHMNYIMKVFFPGVSDHPILNPKKVRMDSPHTHYDMAMLHFEQLISNKYFVLTFIETLENQKTFNIRDKVNVASLIMIVLMKKMEYATDILKSLLLRLIDKSVVNKHPQLMLRRTESVVEKMLTNYMAICMYDYLKDYAGSSLFLLFKAIKHQIEKGLVDAITQDARYSLSEERLLHEQIPHSTVILHIVQDDLDEKVQCKVLDWDTISQVKSKILDALFKNTPFSMRPSINEVDLEWRHGRGGHLILQDEDVTTKILNNWKRLNTLAHYGVKESAVMSLIARQNDNYNLQYNKKLQQSNNNCLHQLQVYHIVKPIIRDNYVNMKNSTVFGNGDTLSSCAIGGERTHKTIPEVYLTRLLAAKGTIQKFVDDFFATILTVNEELPLAVKWLFDLLDEAARHYDISDSDVVHAWKSNSLPLRFWVNFIKNPDFIFDVNKTVTVDASLSAIAQTFMDACSTAEHRLGKDSPSNKLLFAKDIPQYRKMVKQFYRDVARLPPINDNEMCTAMTQLSIHQNDEFDTIAALKELYIYVTKYNDEIILALENDTNCKKIHLAQNLEKIALIMEGEGISGC